MAQPTLSGSDKIVTIAKGDSLPDGFYLGDSESEAAQGLFDVLGSEGDEFADEEPEEQTQSTPEDDEDDEDGESEDEDEGEDDPEHQSAGESEDEDEDANKAEALYEVPDPDAPGGTRKVDLKEMREGYLRTADYTRKRQRDADEHRDTMREVREVRTKYADGLEKLEETLSQLGPKAPDQALRKSNPGEYAAQIAEYQAYRDTLATVGRAKDGVAEEVTAEQREAYQGYVNTQWERVTDVVPEWKDQGTAVKGLAELKSFAMKEFNFSEPEIDSLADARLLLMLKENFDLKQTRSKGKEKLDAKKKSSKRLNPGGSNLVPAKRTGGRKKQRQVADMLAAETGSVRDAARAIELLLDD